MNPMLPEVIQLASIIFGVVCLVESLLVLITRVVSPDSNLPSFIELWMLVAGIILIAFAVIMNQLQQLIVLLQQIALQALPNA